MNRREISVDRRHTARHRVRIVTAAAAVVCGVGAGLIGITFATGSSDPQTGQTQQDGGSNQDSLTTPTQAPTAGTDGQAHAGSGGS